jgi:hypothetical protein
MTARPAAALLLLACAVAGCTGLQHRLDLPAGTLVELSPVRPAALEPATDLLLVNPLGCVILGQGTGEAGLLAVLACIPVVTAVDLALLPVSATVRHGEARDLTALAADCPFTDPGALAAEAFLDGLVAEHGLVRAGTPEAGAQAAPAIRLEVQTQRFTRGHTITWSGRVLLVDPAGQRLWPGTGQPWQGDCWFETARRDVPSILASCDEARAEVAAQATACARRWLDHLAAALAASPPSAAAIAPAQVGSRSE